MKESETIEKELETRNKYKCRKGSMCKRSMLNSEYKSEVISQKSGLESECWDNW